MNNPLIEELISAAVRKEMQTAPDSKVVPIDYYIRKYGVSAEAIRIRLQKGIWRVGYQILELPGVGRHVDLEAMDEWALNQGKSSYRRA